MGEEDTLKNLKVSLLQVICQGLTLDIPINQFAVKLHTWSCLKKPSVIVDAKAEAETEYWIGDTSPGGGVLLKILDGGVLPVSPNPDPTSDQKMSFSTPVFSLAFR